MITSVNIEIKNKELRKKIDHRFFLFYMKKENEKKFVKKIMNNFAERIVTLKLWNGFNLIVVYASANRAAGRSLASELTVPTVTGTQSPIL